MSPAPLLIYLSKANLLDRLFCKDFFAQMGKRPTMPYLILHANTGTTAEHAHFVSKRVAALLSEQLVTAMALPAPQLGLFGADAALVNAPRLHKSWDQLSAVVTQPYGPQDEPLPVATLLQNLRRQLQVSEVWLFPHNPLSALSLEAPLVTNTEAHSRLLAAYPEEADVLQLALALAPARICNVQQLP
jgi:hypothetical protein